MYNVDLIEEPAVDLSDPRNFERPINDVIVPSLEEFLLELYGVR